MINVENMADAARANAASAASEAVASDLRQTIEGRLGAGHKTSTKKTLRNIGPSVSYKLRDASGQAS